VHLPKINARKDPHAVSYFIRRLLQTLSAR
jgi:hypothetical protein